MDLFALFCNICYSKTKTLYKISSGEETIKNILLSFIGSPEVIITDTICLCSSCCEELTRFDKFRETCLTNFLHFRQQYYQMKYSLEFQNDVDMTTKLKDFIEKNVLKATYQDDAYNFTLPEYDKQIKTESGIFVNDICASGTVGGQAKTEHVFIKKEVEIEHDFLKEGTETNPYICKENVQPEHIFIKQELQTCQLFLNAGGLDCEFKSETLACLDGGRENIKHQDLSHQFGEDYKLHYEVDLDSSSDETEERQNVDKYVEFGTHENGEEIRTEQKGNSHTDILAQDDGCGRSSLKKTDSHMCKYCNKCFTSKNVLDTHMRIHTGERPYKCGTCGQTFIQKTSLDIHEFTHSGLKPFKCNICDRTFARKSYLVSHIHTHSGKRPYKCDTCGITFTMKCTLQRHARIHTGEKPYSCNICDRTFIRKSHLVRHALIHTRESPYKCDICGQAFKQKCNLDRHARIHPR